jgi:hypothetical protein
LGTISYTLVGELRFSNADLNKGTFGLVALGIGEGI